MNARTPGGTDLPLRDDLAVDQTTLSNERTLLSYWRTALQCVVGGVSLLKFFNQPTAVILGWIFLPLGLVLGVVGTVLFVRRRRLLSQTGHNAPRVADDDD